MEKRKCRKKVRACSANASSNRRMVEIIVRDTRVSERMFLSLSEAEWRRIARFIDEIIGYQ